MRDGSVLHCSDLLQMIADLVVQLHTDRVRALRDGNIFPPFEASCLFCRRYGLALGCHARNASSDRAPCRCRIGFD